MATFDFATVEGTTIAFDLAWDQLDFGTGTGSAAQLRFEQTGNDLTIWMGTRFVVMEAMTYPLLSSQHLTFADGSLFLAGGAANETLTGGEHDDFLDGRGGTNQLAGGLGDDTYVVDSTSDVVVEVNDGGNDTVRTVVSWALGTNVENLWLRGTGAINGTGNALYNTITAGSGDNVINGAAGGDTVSYADATAGVSVWLAVATAQATGGSGSDTLISIEHARGSAHGDWLRGNAVSNHLWGEGGNDTLASGDAMDFVSGGDGNDLVSGDAGEDVVSGDAGDDTVVGGTGNDQLSGGAGSDTVRGGDDPDDLYAAGIYGSDTASDHNALFGEAGHDRLFGSTGMDSLYGDLGNDTLEGASGADWMYGGDGFDVLRGDSGNDFANGGTGNDTLYGGVGSDTLHGGDGADVLNGAGTYLPAEATSDTNRLYGGANNDTLYASLGIDWLDGGDGVDTVSFASAADYRGARVNLALASAQDTFSGLDTLVGVENAIGSAYADVLRGSSVANRLEGGNGNDWLFGGGGNDFLAGGAGADMFVFATVDESLAATPDVVSDFMHAQGDRVDVSRIDADEVAAGNQAFTFIGGAAFSADATGQLRYNATTGVLYASNDADTAAEFVLVLTGMPALVAADFVL